MATLTQSATGPTIRSTGRPREEVTARTFPRAAVDAGVLTLLVLLSLTALAQAFPMGALVVAGTVGAVLGLGLALVGARWRVGAFTLAAGAALGYAVVAPAVLAPDAVVAGVVPTPRAWQEVAVATVRAWRDTLTLQPPFEQRPTLLAVPLLLALVATLLAVSFALRLRRPWWALLPVAAVLVGATLLGSRDAALVLPRGALVAAGVLGWAAWRWRERGGSAAQVTGDRGVAAAAVVVLAVAGGTVLAPVVVPGEARYVLRDQVVPPLELKDYVSPLQSYRAWVRDLEEETILSVSGLPADTRIRLATMDGYDGMVYDVTEGAHGASFASSPSVLPLPAAPEQGETVTVEVTVGSYQGVWVPTIGEPRSITFGPDDDAQNAATQNTTAQARGLYYDTATRVALTTAQLAPGDTYTLTAVVGPTPGFDQLAGKAAGAVTLPEVTNVPTIVSSTGAEMGGEGEDLLTLVTNLQTALRTTGFFSHGLEGETPSRSGHGAERISAFLVADQIVGDDEQYAVALALMARQLGIPARVVMGFVPEPGASGDVELTGAQLRVWTEVAFETYGWVAIDATPDEDQTPQDSTSEPRSNPRPQVLQPPPPPEEPIDEPPISARDSDVAEGEDEIEVASAPWLVAGAAGGAFVLLALLPFALVLAAKTRRARRRRAAPVVADRISGAWAEVLDAATDLGTQVPASATRRQGAALLERTFAVPAALTLAGRTDAHVFGRGDPATDDAAAVWQEAGAVVGRMRAAVGPWRRLRARLSRRSLRAERARRREERRAVRSRTSAATDRVPTAAPRRRGLGRTRKDAS